METTTARDLPVCECHEPVTGVATEVNLLLVVIALPLVSFLGIFANLLNIRVFSRHRSSASHFLMALSCSDLGVCTAGLAVIWADSLRAYSDRVDQLFVFLLPLLTPPSLFFQMLSVYITVLAAIDLYLSLTPSCGCLSSRWRSIGAWRLVGLCALTVAAYNAVQFWDLEAVECVLDVERGLTHFELCPTQLRVSDFYVKIYKGFLYAFSMAIFPFSWLSLLTISIIFLLHRRHTAKSIDGNSKEEGMKEEDADASPPSVLVLVVVLFLVCNVISLYVNVGDIFPEMELVPAHLQPIFIDVGNLLVVFNATANCFIYFFFCSDYRRQASHIFSRVLTPRRTPKKEPLVYNA